MNNIEEGLKKLGEDMRKCRFTPQRNNIQKELDELKERVSKLEKQLEKPEAENNVKTE